MLPHTRRTVASLATVGLMLAQSGCGSSPTAPTRNQFAIRACNAVYHVQVADATVAQQADGLVGKGNVKVVCGLLKAGDGGFNAPWPWHLDPASIKITDGVVEIYDNCPQGAEKLIGTPAEWLCPWGTEVLRRE